MKVLLILLIGLLIGLVVSLLLLFPKLRRVYWTIHLFDKDKIAANFMGMYHKYNAREIPASGDTFHFPRGEELLLPKSFTHDGMVYNTEEYIASSFTTGFAVVQNSRMVFEKYYAGNSESTQYISWSMAKSVVSALFGIAIEEGFIQSIHQTVDEYLPELAGSGYEGVKIKDVLQMSAGLKFNEDYGDFKSDINRWGRWFAFGASQNKFATSLLREEEPGKTLHYISINTHVLGMIIAKASGKSLSTYLEEKLWRPMGMEYSAYWLCDNSGMEVALGGLNIALRDYAKIGQLFLNQGEWRGAQLVPKAWIRASVTPDEEHLKPENNKLFGYGYQWWIPPGIEGEFMAMGVYNQYIYVNPACKTVIAVNSANHRYNEEENPYADPRVILELFRSIAHKAIP